MKKLLVFAAFVLACCSPQKPSAFSHDGVSFSCPAGWEISDQQPIDGIGYYVSAQKTGLSESGLFTLTWVKGELDTAQNLETYQQQMRGNSIYKASDLAFTNAAPGKYAGRNTLSVQFTANILSIRHHGAMHSFLDHGRTFTVLIQQADDDSTENEEGYAVIEQSFSFKG